MAVNALFDALYCEEEKWAALEDDNGDEQEEAKDSDTEITFDGNSALLLEPQDSSCDDEELQSLFLKEKETLLLLNPKETHSFPRKEAVEWILRTAARCGFSALSSIFAVNYLDRFVSGTSLIQPWTTRLVAVACLSLAAKVEETRVPSLLDLQVVDGGAEYVFEAETVKRMELLVLSALKWRMNPLTPLSFVDHLVRRIRLSKKSHHTHWEFLSNCENLILSIISDSRFMRYPPSVIATAAMLHVVRRVITVPCDVADYENRLLGVIRICKEEVDDCYNLTAERLIAGNKKRVMDSCFSSDDCSNDSSSSSSSSSSSFHFNKKRMVQEQQMKLPCRVFSSNS